LERGAHEWWPWRSDSDVNSECSCHCFTNDRHNGRGRAIRPANVLNIGEHFTPMDHPEAKMIAFFNGHWGKWYSPVVSDADTPEGPLSLDRAYAFAARQTAVYVRQNSTYALRAAMGSEYYPVPSMQDAFLRLVPGGTIWVAPGIYREALFNQPGTFA